MIFNRTKTKHINLLVIFVLSIILLIASYIRLVNIPKRGIIYFDEFQYLEVAKWWTEGNLKLDGYYRPAIYFIDSLAVRLFGYNDHSINLFHSLMDIGNIILIFYITALITGKSWLGICSSLMYSFFPSVLEYTYRFYPHIPSATFVLLALLFYLKFHSNITNQSKAKILFLVLSGLSSGIAAHIHPDLAFFAPVYILLIFFSLRKGMRNKKLVLKKWLIYTVVFSITFISISIWGVLYYGLDTILEILIRERSDGAQHISPIGLFVRILIGSVDKFTLPLLTDLFFLSLFIFIFHIILRKRIKFGYLVPLVLTFGYGVIGSIAMTRYLDRLIIPIIPLIVISIIVGLYYILRGIIRNDFVLSSILIGLSIVVGFYNLFLNRRVYSIKYELFFQSYFREIHDFLKDKVDNQNRILITPYLIWSRHKGFQAPFYFGEDALYIIDYPYSGDELDSLIDQENIRYIFWGKINYDYGLLTGNPWASVPQYYYGGPWKKPPVDFYGLRKNDWENGYSVDEEKKILQRFFKSDNAKLIYSSNSGEIYELKI